MYDKSWGTDASVLSSRLPNFGPLKWGWSALQGRIWEEGQIIFNRLLAQLVGCWLCFLEVVGWTPTWPVSGGTTAARRERVWEELLRFSHEGFPSIHGLRTMVNAFLPIRPDVTSVRHVIGDTGHRVGFAGVGGTCILDVLHTCHVYWIG